MNYNLQVLGNRNRTQFASAMIIVRLQLYQGFNVNKPDYHSFVLTSICSFFRS